MREGGVHVVAGFYGSVFSILNPVNPLTSVSNLCSVSVGPSGVVAKKKRTTHTNQSSLEHIPHVLCGHCSVVLYCRAVL